MLKFGVVHFVLEAEMRGFSVGGKAKGDDEDWSSTLPVGELRRGGLSVTALMAAMDIGLYRPLQM